MDIYLLCSGSHSLKCTLLTYMDGEGKFITSVETEHCLLCADKSGYLYFSLGALTIGKYSLNLEIHN